MRGPLPLSSSSNSFFMNEPEILEAAPLAYENQEFLSSAEGRALRILAEYSEPLSRFRHERIQDTVVFFGSARFASRSDAESALELLERPGSAQPADFEHQLKLAQTQKLAKKILVLIYGRDYWNKILNLPALVEAGAVSEEDLELFTIVDSPQEGFEMLRDGLTKYHLQQQIPVRREKDDDPDIAATRSRHKGGSDGVPRPE